MTTPNMDLTLPTPLVTPGPDYAQEVNDALTTVDGHDHSGGGTGGKQLGTNALVINADLPLNGFNETSVRAERFNDGTTAVGADVRALYVTGGDLYYNNNSAVPVKITSGGALNTGVTSTVLNSRAVSTNTVIAASDPYTYYRVDSTAGAVLVTLPTAATAAAGRWFIFEDVNGQAATNNITIQRSGGDVIGGGTSVVLSSAYAGLAVFSDGISIWSVGLLFTSDAAFGNVTAATFTTANYVQAGAAPYASAGAVRLPSLATIRARNAANSDDIILVSCDGADNVGMGGTTSAASCVIAAKSGGTITCEVAGGATLVMGTNCVINGSAVSSTGSVFSTVSVTSGGVVQCSVTSVSVTCPNSGEISLGAGTSGTVSISVGGATLFSCNGTGLGLYAAAAVAQAARAGQLTDSTGGTPGSTLAAIAAGAGYAQSDMVAVKNALASLAAKYNAVELALHNLGVTA